MSLLRTFTHCFCAHTGLSWQEPVTSRHASICHQGDSEGQVSQLGPQCKAHGDQHRQLFSTSQFLFPDSKTKTLLQGKQAQEGSFFTIHDASHTGPSKSGARVPKGPCLHAVSHASPQPQTISFYQPIHADTKACWELRSHVPLGHARYDFPCINHFLNWFKTKRVMSSLLWPLARTKVHQPPGLPKSMHHTIQGL